MDVTSMEDRIEQAARRTAISLMRLNEAIDQRDAETYSMAPGANGWPERWNRKDLLDRFYYKWFLGVARESEAGEVTGRMFGPGSDSQRLENMEDSE